MITTISRWNRFSSPSASALIARSILGEDAVGVGYLGAQAVDPDPAEPVDPDDQDQGDQTGTDLDVPEDPVTGENDDQEPTPR